MNFDWQYTLGLLVNADFWRASWVVVQLSLLSWLASTVLGFGLALAKQSKHAVLNGFASAYIWLFRSLPLLILLIFIYSLPQVFPAARSLLSNSFIAGLIALVLSETAYMAEIHRGGLIAVHKGQVEAGRALGLSFPGIQRLIVIPQAVRVAMPALSNELVTIVKLTSLVSVISLAEILLVGQRLYTQNFLILETLTAVAIFYVLIVSVFNQVLGLLERNIDVLRRGAKARTLTPAEIQAQLPANFEAKRSTPEPTASSPAALEAISLHKSYAGVEVLKGVSLRVEPGEVISIIGRSGSGKTTFIRLLNGLERVDEGKVKLHGEPFISATRTSSGKASVRENNALIRQIGMVFQGFNLFNHKTVLENVLLAPRYHGLGNAEKLQALGFHYLNKVGMAAHAYKYPHQLSGGQQQRVAIARALMMSPSIILFDEPTSALDPETVGEVLNVIRSLAKEGVTMLIVTHEMSFAFEVSNRVVLMEGGRVVCDDSPVNLRSSTYPGLQPFLKNLNA